MAPPPSYSSRDEDEDRPRRRGPVKKSGPPLAPILALVVVIIGAIVVARIAAQKPKEAAAPPKVDASTVFGDLPEEQPPVPGGGGSGRYKTTNKAPTGLANNPTWIAALKLSDEAHEVFERAKTAKASGNHSEWNKLGNEAKDMFDKALVDTALWEEELLTEYGDTDRQVRAIMKTRSKWFDITRALHKTTGRG